MTPTRLHGDIGSVSTEMVIVAPIAVLLLCLITLVGRTSSARDTVNSAARDAARSASLERNPNNATAAATQSASAALASSSTRCASVSVDADVTSYGPGGQVAVTVTCDIKLSDLGLLGLSGTRAVTARAVEVVDQYRAVTT